MINVVPINPSTATQQQIVVEITEPLCGSVCTNNVSLLAGSVSFHMGTLSTINGLTIVPVIATGDFVLNGSFGSCKNSVRHFAEKFELAFTATTDNIVTLTAGANVATAFVNQSCCKSNKVKMTTTLTADIA